VAANEAAGDPYAGRFPFEEAVAGLPAEGRLHAILVTDEGEIDCILEPDHAPIAVANFVGLARGLRPFRDEASGEWIKERYFDGTPWHRAIEGQIVQGGRRGNSEDGGYLIQDEISPGDSFDRAGVLAVANSGPNSGSSQFFITTGPTPHLAGLHTIFGHCDDESVARALERRSARGEGPAPNLQKIRIVRK
jgi:peptidyl-prolyl cis-trans isomerase A (cyclophilin A)